jgi:hypothetical protein
MSQWLGAGSDGGETARAFLDEAGRFPVLIQHLNPLGVDPADHGPGGDADGMGWANWGGPGYSEHRVGAVDQGGDLLELFGTDLVAHGYPPVGTAGASS